MLVLKQLSILFLILLNLAPISWQIVNREGIGKSYLLSGNKGIDVERESESWVRQDNPKISGL